MSHDAGEVSWQTLRRIVHEWSGEHAELEQVSSLAGGSISTTLLLVTKTGDRAVLKVSPHRVDRSYIREAHQLELLRSLGLPAPRVWGNHVGTLDRPDSYLLIEFMPGQSLHDARDAISPAANDVLQEKLAELVIAMHRHRGETYGRVEKPGRPANPLVHHAAWPACFRSLYDSIWSECEAQTKLPPKARRQISKIHERLEKLIDHTDGPRLIHGDLWASNVMVRDSGDGAWSITGLLDPNCKFAHAESELAYLELFKTITPAFMKRYQLAFPVDDNYRRVRQPIYQLYELINHVNLFGERYLKPLLATLEKLAPVVQRLHESFFRSLRRHQRAHREVV